MMQGMLEICNMTALNYSQLIINHTTVQLVLCYTLYIYIYIRAFRMWPFQAALRQHGNMVLEKERPPNPPS